MYSTCNLVFDGAGAQTRNQGLLFSQEPSVVNYRTVVFAYILV